MSCSEGDRKSVVVEALRLCVIELPSGRFAEILAAPLVDFVYGVFLRVRWRNSSIMRSKCALFVLVVSHNESHLSKGLTDERLK